MIRSPAGFDGEIRIKRYMDYYQASYGVMMLSSGQFGAGTAAGYLLGAEPSGYATDFTAGGVQGNALVRSSPQNTLMDYSGTPFLAQGGPVTFSRGTLATVTDSDGLIKWAPHNLLLASEQFDASSWTKTSITPTANAVAAPNGTTTADTLTASGANGTTLQSYTAIAVPYTFGVWLKRKTGTGTIEIAADNGTYTTVTITNDWALYTVTQTPAAGSKSAGIRIVSSGDEVYAWGAHLYRSDLGGMQANASAYPYYNPSTPKNLLGFTELLTTGWTNTNTTDSQVAVAAPNGSANSIEVTATAGNGTLLASLSLLASPYTFSIWLKRKTGTGTVEITVDGTTYVTAAVTSDWQRFSTTLTPSAGTKTPGIRLVTSGDAVYAWGAQLSDSASLDTYVPNFGAAPSAAAAYGPRLDYDGSTLAAKGLLVEEARTNALSGANFINPSSTAGFTAFGDAAGVMSVVSDATALAAAGLPAGNVLKIDNSGGSTPYYVRIDNSLTLGSNTWAMSAYARGSGTFTFDMNAGTWTGSTTPSIATSYQRISSVGSSSVSSNQFRMMVSGGGVAYVLLFQAEQGAFPTSVIPNTGTSITRNADVASVGVSQFPYSSTEGTIVVAWQLAQLSGSPAAIHLTDAAENNRIRINANLAGLTRSTIFAAGSLVDNIDTATAATGITKYAIGGASANYAVYRNGSSGGTSTNSGFPSGCTEMRIGRDGASGNFNGHIRQITYLPRRISNAELQARTV